MSVKALLLPERLRWKVCLYYFCFAIFPCFVLDTSPLMSHVCAQGFETLAQMVTECHGFSGSLGIVTVLMHGAH